MIDLRQGDCLEIMKGIPNESIDCVITSPPYDNLRTYNDTLNWNFEIFKKIAQELFRILKKGGVVVWVVSDATIKGSETGSSFKQALYFKEIGFNLHDTMIWSKPQFTAVGAIKTRYAQTFEYMFVFSKGKIKCFNPLRDRRTKGRSKSKCGKLRLQNGNMRSMSSLGKKYGGYGIRYNVWNMPPVMSNIERTGHPAQFPIQLAKDHIISWTNERDLVIDPFMGSGTTGVACVNTNRNFIGIELDKNYFEIAKDRINKAIEDK